MTPPNVIFVPQVTGFVDLVSGTCTSSISNHYVTHINIVGDPEWDGRAPSTSFYFAVTPTSADQIQFYFANDADRSTALASYSTWRIVGTDGLSEIVTPGLQTASRLRWITSADFSAGETYTVQGQA